MGFKEIADDVLKEIAELLKGSKQFVLSHAPDLAKEIVKLGMVEGFALIMCGVVFECGVLVANMGYVSMWWSTAEIVDGANLCLPWYSWLFVGIGLIPMVCGTFDVIHTAFAPKLYILKSLKDLLAKKELP